MTQKETLLNQVQLFLIHEGYMKLYRQIQGVKGVERAQEAFFVCSGCGFGSIEKVAKSSQVHCIVWWGGHSQQGIVLTIKLKKSHSVISDVVLGIENKSGLP